MDWDIVYPVILLGKQGVRVACDSEQLITTQKSLLQAGLYNDRLLVDSVGWARHLKEAREPAVGLGLLSRWRALWNPSALFKVELVFDSELTSVSVDELKERLLESLAGRPQNLAEWDAGTINFDQLKEGMGTSKTFAEIFSLVRAYTTIRPELR
jgi:hypothetical protein